MKKSYVLYCEDNVFQTETQLFVPLSKYGTSMALKISSKEYQFKHKIYLPPHFLQYTNQYSFTNLPHRTHVPRTIIIPTKKPHYPPFQPLESIEFYVVIPKIFCKFEETLISRYYGNIPLLADTGRIAAGIGTCRIFLPADETGKRRYSCHGTHRFVRAARSHVVPETAI